MEREKVYLLIGGGDGFDAHVVTASELDDAFIALHFDSSKDAPEDQRKAYLDHLHDQDNWERNHALGGVRYSQGYEDGYVEVIQLAGGINERLAAYRVIREVESERRRQITVEGWDAKHDDEHRDGGLAQAAACYASLAAVYAKNGGGLTTYATMPPPFRWPWESRWWKPKNPRRDLVRAAAMLIAELERLDRAAPATDCPHYWIPNSGQGGEPVFKPNRQMSKDPLMHVLCSQCGCRTWYTEKQWYALPVTVGPAGAAS